MIIYENPQYMISPTSGEVAAINCTVDGQLTSIPITTDNTDYVEIMRQVDAGELTIAPADE